MLRTCAITKWCIHKDWKDTEKFPNHKTKANQQKLSKHNETLDVKENISQLFFFDTRAKHNTLLTRREVNTAGYWPRSSTSSRSIKTPKKTKEANIQPSWPNKLSQRGIYYTAKLEHFCLRDQRGISCPLRYSQSESRIRFILSARKFGNTINIVSPIIPATNCIIFSFLDF